MNMKKSFLVAGAVTTIGLAGVTGMGVASAATNVISDNPDSSLIDKLATKFNLNKDEVKAVFDEQHAEREAKMEQKLTERLDQAVKDGKLTEEQKDKILAKHKELKTSMKAERESFEDKTPEERKALIEQKRADLEQWAKDNGIPTDYLPIMKAGPGQRHIGMMSEKAQ